MRQAGFRGIKMAKQSGGAEIFDQEAEARRLLAPSRHDPRAKAHRDVAAFDRELRRRAGDRQRGIGMSYERKAKPIGMSYERKRKPKKKLQGAQRMAEMFKDTVKELLSIPGNIKKIHQEKQLLEMFDPKSPGHIEAMKNRQKYYNEKYGARN